QSRPCIEVKLQLSSYRTGIAPIDLQPELFGTEPPKPPKGIDYGGVVITDGSTYAPQMPWYMAHYCDALFGQNDNDMQDPVCYGDYFSPMNNGFNLLPMQNLEDWPKSVPWSVFPRTESPGPSNHCKPGLTQCTLVLGGFNLVPVPAN